MARTQSITSVNRQTVGQALRQARANCANSPRWLAAVNRAALNLEACAWQYDGTTLRIESATDAGHFYHATPHTCDCQAAANGKPCWHRAGARLLQLAAEVAEQTVLIIPPRKPMAEAQTAVDELFS